MGQILILAGKLSAKVVADRDQGRGGVVRGTYIMHYAVDTMDPNPGRLVLGVGTENTRRILGSPG